MIPFRLILKSTRLCCRLLEDNGIAIMRCQVGPATNRRLKSELKLTAVEVDSRNSAEFNDTLQAMLLKIPAEGQFARLYE